jgi:hypothetical protein
MNPGTEGIGINAASISLFIIILLTIILIRIITSRLLNSLSERGSISGNVRDISIRIIDIVLVVILISTALMLFIPQYWGILTIFGLLGLVALVLFIHPLISYISMIILQMELPLKNKYYEILMPGFQKPLTGKILKITSGNTVVKDIHGVEHYIPNIQLIRAIFKPLPPQLTLRVVVDLPGGGNSMDYLSELDRQITEKLEEYRHPGFKDVKKIVLAKASNSRLEYLITLYPVQATIRDEDVRKAMIELVSTLSKTLDGKASSINVVSDQPF